MEREVGGGIGMGNTCKPMAVLFQCMTKFTTNKKKKNKIKNKKKKVISNLDSMLKSRNITLLTKVHVFKDMVFPAVMYGWEIWSIKNAEH